MTMEAVAIKRMRPWAGLCGALLVSACVTINVYFPAAAAEKAADRIIDEVWGEDAKKDQSSQRRIPPATAERRIQRWIIGVVEFLLPAAEAQQANLDISSPGINAIKDRMQARHEQLRPFYESGAVGLTVDGGVALRDPKAVSLKDRQRVNALVADENRDRSGLYAEIARANGHPEWEQGIRETFARRWVDKAGTGWWYQSGGGWRQR